MKSLFVDINDRGMKIRGRIECVFCEVRFKSNINANYYN